MRSFLPLLLALSLSSAVVAEEPPLTNEDVVKLSSMGLGEELIVAKVEEAPRVDFRLAVEDLAALRNAGVSDGVVKAMLARNRPVAPVFTPPPAPGVREELGLRREGGETPIQALAARRTTAGFGVFASVFMNYEGLKARVRTSDRRPVFTLRSSTPLPKRGLFLGKLDADVDDEVRSLKVASLGRGLATTLKGNALQASLEPAPAWTVPFDMVEESAGVWKLTPKQDLASGEYGWYVIPSGLPITHLFDFAVD